MSKTFGRFELLERIGVGGMAEVWKARVAGVGGFEKILVLKKILPAFVENKTFVEMLLAEARLCAVLQHANIVQTYENGEIDGQFYIAMEYVKGYDLFKILSRVTQLKKKIPASLCLYIASEVAKGLDYAHQAKDHQGRPLNIIHRDVSPSNILISETGEVKVMDFGVARATMDGTPKENQSRAGVLKGKLGYMSPEQVTGQPFDLRSDIFSLGIILYESMTLKRLFLGRTDLETLVNIRDAKIEHKFRKHSYIEESVRALLRRSLAREPQDRYDTALDFHDDISSLLFEQKTHVNNRTLARYLEEIFNEELPEESEQEASVAKSKADTGPSLTFSPKELKQHQAEIRKLRAQRRDSNTAGTSEEMELAASRLDTAVAIHGVKRRRQSAAVASTARLATSARTISADDTAPDPQDVEEGEVLRDSKKLRTTKSFNTGSRRELRAATSTGQHQPVKRRPSSAGSQDNSRVVEYRVQVHNGDVLGPFSLQALETMVLSHTVDGETAVSVSGGPYIPLSELAELVPVLAKIESARATPTAKGDLKRVELPRLFYRLFSQRFSGCLEVSNGNMNKSIYFKKGRPVHITSNQRGEMLGAFLVSQGVIGQSDVDLAVATSNRGGGRLGDVVVAMNLLKPYQLYQVLEKQIRARFVDIFGWEAGSWRLYSNVKPPASIVPLDLDPIAAMVEGVRTKMSLSLLESYFGDRNEVPFSKTSSSVINVEALRLQAREAKALGKLMSSETLAQARNEKCRSRQQQLSVLHVLLLLVQTDLLSFPDAAA